MGLAAGPLCKGKLADGTLVTVGLTVKDFVDCKRSALTKALVTRPALVRLVLRVDVFVVPEMVLSPESFAADITREGPLISVGPLVDHNIVRLGELSVTKLADEPLLWSRGSGLGLVRMIWVHWMTLTMTMMKARVKLVMTKPLLQQQGLTEARG